MGKLTGKRLFAIADHIKQSISQKLSGMKMYLTFNPETELKNFE